MFKHSLLAIGAALLISSCASSRYTTMPPDAAQAPDPHALLKAMSTRLASTKQYRFTATRTMAPHIAEASHQPAKATVDVLVARPNRAVAKLTSKEARREMIYDGRTFTVVDGNENFYSKAPLPGSLDSIPGLLAKIYGFQPPLAELIISDPYRDITRRIQSLSYLGTGAVNDGGNKVRCHRVGLHGSHSDGELWLGIDDSLPRRLTASGKDSAGHSLLVDFDIPAWDLNPQVSGSEFHHRPAPGAVEIPMVTLEEAKAAR